jgi:hypothetical protein
VDPLPVLLDPCHAGAVGLRELDRDAPYEGGGWWGRGILSSGDRSASGLLSFVASHAAPRHLECIISGDR